MFQREPFSFNVYVPDLVMAVGYSNPLPTAVWLRILGWVGEELTGEAHFIGEASWPILRLELFW